MNLPVLARKRLQHALLCISRSAQGRDDFGDVVGAASFHGDFYRSFAEANAVISAVIIGLNYVGAMLRQN